MSDPHFDVVNLGVARFDDVAKVLWEAVGHAIKAEADLFICGGDLYDPDSGPVVLRGAREIVLAAETLRSHKIPSVWVCGNHDVAGDGETTSLDPLLGLNGEWVHVVRGAPSAIMVGEWCVVGLPYPSSPKGWGNTHEPLAKMRAGRPNKRFLAVGHLSIKGVVPGEESAEMARGKDVFWLHDEVAKLKPEMRLAAHYHRRSITPEGIQIIGSACALGFGRDGEDSQEHGYLVVEVP